MAKNPSSRYYWKDWRGDTAVQSCSDAAQGFWAWLLCLCAEAGGYLLIAGKAPTVKELAHLRGREPRVIGRQLAELERAGVFSRTEDGVIFNRRMVREAENTAGKKTGKSRKIPERSEPDFFEKSTPTHARAPATLPQGSEATPTDSRSDSNPLPSLAAREDQKHEEPNPEARCARLGGNEGERCRPPGSASDASRSRPPPHEPRSSPTKNLGAKSIAPGRMGSSAQPVGGTNDGRTSLPSPAADTNRLGFRDQARTYPLAGCILPANQRDLELHDQDNDNPRQEPAMCTHGFSPVQAALRPILGAVSVLSRSPPCRKSPALKAKIKQQLQAKHCRFLLARGRPNEIGAYWEVMAGDDQAQAQRVFDAVDRRMRAARWDDHGVAA